MNKMNDDFIMLPTVDFCFKELMHLDVRVQLSDGTQIDMEMQVASFEHWDKRILFYLAKMFTDQLKKGEYYDKLQKCIHVSILDFTHFSGDNICYRRLHFRDDRTKELYTDLLELQILELKKLPSKLQSEEEILNWMKFFCGKNRKEFLDMAKKNEYLDEAYQTLLTLSADEKKRLEYEAREKALKDYNSQIHSAEERGIKIGEEYIVKLINELISQGRMEDVARITNDTTYRTQLLKEFNII